MLKKLKRRFVRLSMVIIGLVLVVFYFFIVVLMLFSVTENIKSSLSGFASDSFINSRHDSEEKNLYAFTYNVIDFNSICVVQMDNGVSRILLDIENGNMTDTMLNEIVEYVQNANADFGHINKWQVFYSRVDTDTSQRIVIADSSQYFLYVQDLFLDSAVVLLFVLLLLYVINLFLSNIFLKPVEKAWEQQQNFIADASHELKTPLTVILANTEILQAHKHASVEEQMKWIDSTNEEASHMKELVDKMLMLAKADNDKNKMVFSPVNLSRLATQLILQFEPVAYEVGVELNSDIEGGIMLDGDQTALNQMIHILVDNSIKYAGTGGAVKFLLGRKQNMVLMSVQNTGTPIPPEDIPHLFERFFRSDKARTAGKGYGLGLAICKTLADIHKADIDVVSDTEHGTCFTVKFKVKKQIGKPHKK